MQARAYISVEKSTVVYHSDDDYWWCTIAFKNVGLTPASHVRVEWECWIDALPDYMDKKRGPGEVTTFTLFPGQEKTAQKRVKIGKGVKRLILANEMAVWADGTIHYKDAFGQDRHACFRSFTGKFLGNSDTRMSICKDGNHAN